MPDSMLLRFVIRVYSRTDAVQTVKPVQLFKGSLFLIALLLGLKQSATHPL